MTNQELIVTKEVINRLVRYKNTLQKFKALGLTKIFSDNLGDSVGVSSSLVRKDLSIAQISLGNRRGGYPIDPLLQALDHILGSPYHQKTILVGCGKIGTALMNYPAFSTDAIQIVAGFDINPAILQPDAPIPILHINQLTPFIQEHDIQIAILAVPEQSAAAVVEQLAAAGIRGVLNFSPVQLKAGTSLIIQNINIALEIENLFYSIRFQ